MATVKAIITGEKKGETSVSPYNKTDGLQFVRAGGTRADQLVTYKVPTYEVRIEGGGRYTAVRFGLTNDGTTPATRKCNAGLIASRVCTPTWVAGYSPHSFRGAQRAGAWRLLKDREFLIHEGADARTRVGGSIGCVEILDGKWNDFLAEIEKLAGKTVVEIGRDGLLKVTIESADYPTATLGAPVTVGP